jgi:hypothetical protein
MCTARTGHLIVFSICHIFGTLKKKKCCLLYTPAPCSGSLVQSVHQTTEREDSSVFFTIYTENTDLTQVSPPKCHFITKSQSNLLHCHESTLAGISWGCLAESDQESCSQTTWVVKQTTNKIVDMMDTQNSSLSATDTPGWYRRNTFQSCDTDMCRKRCQLNRISSFLY